MSCTCLAEGLGIRATARVFESLPTPVLHWLVEAAAAACFFRVFPLYAPPGAAATRRGVRGVARLQSGCNQRRRSHPDLGSPSWVWTAMDPTSKLLVVVEVGSRTARHGPTRRTSGDRDVGARLCPAVCDRMCPQGLWDGTADAVWLIVAPRASPGHRTDAQTAMDALPPLRYAQVVKSYRRRHLVGVTHRWCSAPGWLSNSSWRRVGGPSTRLVERLNLDIRQRVAAIGRRVQHALPGGSGRARSVDAVSRLSQPLIALRCVNRCYGGVTQAR